MKDLQKSENKLRKRNKVANIVIITLILVVIVICILSFIGVHDSWFFKNVLGIGEVTVEKTVIRSSPKPKESKEPEEEVIDAGSIITLRNVVEGGFTKYKFVLREDEWQMFETKLLGNDESVDIDLSVYVSNGVTKIIKITEYYGRFGNYMSSKEEYLSVQKRK